MGLKDIFEQAAENLYGTIHTPEQALSSITDRTDILDEFLDFLDANDIYECSACGWWGYPGEILNEDGMCWRCEEDDE